MSKIGKKIIWDKSSCIGKNDIHIQINCITRLSDRVYIYMYQRIIYINFKIIILIYTFGNLKYIFVIYIVQS